MSRKKPRSPTPPTDTRFGDAPGSDLLTVALQAAPCSMFLVDNAGLIVFANHQALQLFQYDEDELVGQMVERLIPAELQGAHRQRRDEYWGEPSARPMGKNRDVMAVRKDGSEVPVEVGLNPVAFQGQHLVLAAMVDLTERLLAQRFLTEKAERLTQARDHLTELVATDDLTGLRNRRSFLDQLGLQIEMCARTTRPISVLFLDVDYFKPYNDEFGHLAGDDVLRRIAAILRSVARGSDFVARIGGEEFAIILPDTDDRGAVILGERFRERVAAAEWSLRPVTVSVGATTLAPSKPGAPQPTWAKMMLLHADQALYQSKGLGRNRVSHKALETGT